jgi:hypothetical protein
MGMRAGFVAFCCALLLTSSAWAATVDPGIGDTSVSQGQGFLKINGRVEANVGDQVMVSPGGSATITYGDGCKQQVTSSGVATIQNPSPCAAGAFAQAGDPAIWIVGGLTLGAAIIAGIEASRHGSTNTTPPLSP